MKPHESPLTYPELRSRLEPFARERLVLTRCQYGPNPKKSRRLLVYAYENDRLVERLNAWVPPDVFTTADDWARGLDIRIGRCDAMYATGAQALWFHTPDEFLVFTAGKNDSLGLTHAIGRDGGFTAVHCYISANWVERGVRLIGPGETGDKTALTIVEISEPIALIDPTYDGLDVMMDAGWATSLGRELADFLKVNLRIDDALR